MTDRRSVIGYHRESKNAGLTQRLWNHSVSGITASLESQRLWNHSGRDCTEDVSLKDLVSSVRQRGNLTHSFILSL